MGQESTAPDVPYRSYPDEGIALEFCSGAGPGATAGMVVMVPASQHAAVSRYGVASGFNFHNRWCAAGATKPWDFGSDVGGPVDFGASKTTRYFDASMEQPRVLRVMPSLDWAATEFANQSAPSSFRASATVDVGAAASIDEGTAGRDVRAGFRKA